MAAAQCTVQQVAAPRPASTSAFVIARTAQHTAALTPANVRAEDPPAPSRAPELSLLPPLLLLPPLQLAGLSDELGPGFTGTLFAPSDDAVEKFLVELGSGGLDPALAQEILVSCTHSSRAQKTARKFEIASAAALQLRA